MDLNILRHSCAHIMASAVKKLYPDVKFAIGPAIENGFYYDFDIPGGIKEDDLGKLEKLMKKEINQNHFFEYEEWSKEKAITFFNNIGEKYKVELINELEVDKVSIYKHNDFVDLCKGPHVKSTDQVKHFKLLSTSGAYWKGVDTNP
ncbi:MAG: threonine--tRNA ligase, partial [Candidatus Omnitrophica bacterium]|nr:threonine--tRNA ligase [Candidatus Omnitrophota bacterium]